VSSALREQNHGTREGGARVRATLVCGWCARRVDDVAGEIQVGTGQLQIVAGDGFRLYGRRPVCAHCGGPLFLDNWRHVGLADNLRIPEPDAADDTGDVSDLGHGEPPDDTMSQGQAA
jgi:hypothetical protein